MTRRRFILSAVPVVVGLVAVAVYTAWPTPPLIPGVTKENFARIRNGMTQNEVETIFGRPRDVAITFDLSPRMTVAWHSEGKEFEKGFDVCDVCVNLDTHGRVIGKLWAGEPETLMQKIRRWLHLPNMICRANCVASHPQDCRDFSEK